MDKNYETLNLLKELVSVASADENEKGVAELVKTFTESIGMDVQCQEVLPERCNVIASTTLGKGGPCLVFNTHMDVVPAGDGWSHNPFDLVVRDGKAYGRGACDAKGPLAAMLIAIKRMIQDPGELNGKIVMTAVVDEENSSRGAKELVKHVKGDFAIVGEPTQCKVATCHKGSLRPVIRIDGKASHATLPEQGINAIRGASHFVLAMDELAGKLKNTEHPLLGHPTIAVTKISGGIKENMVPGKCELVIDRRMVPGETEEHAIESINAVCQSVEKQHFEGKVYIDRFIPTTGGPSEINADHKLVSGALKIVEEVTGQFPGPIGLSCGTDMVHLMSIGIPTLIIGPGSLDQAHKADEFVELSQLELATRIYEMITRYILSGGGYV